MTTDISNQIIQLCKTPNTALQAIHLLLRMSKATESAFMAIYDRVMADNDVDGAYYLAVFAQKVDDLPFDVIPLIKMIMNSDDENMKLSLIDKLPKEMQNSYLNDI